MWMTIVTGVVSLLPREKVDEPLQGAGGAGIIYHFSSVRTPFPET